MPPALLNTPLYPSLMGRSPRLNVPTLHREDKEKRSSSQHVEDDLLEAPSSRPALPFETSFASLGLATSLGLDEIETPMPSPARSLSSPLSSKAERLPDEMLLETVRKRQANQAIQTLDIFQDFRKTATLLGADASFDATLETHFAVVNQETRQSPVDEKWIKTLLTRLAKQLDAKVSTTLDETSRVVQNWLEALFTQPIEWTPFALPDHETDPSSQGLPTAMPTRVRHLVMQDALSRLSHALETKRWEDGDRIIQDVFTSIPPEAMSSDQRQQWQGLQFKLWQKQGKSQTILEQGTRLDSPEQSPEIKRVMAYAFAETGDYKEALRTLYPLVTLASDAEKGETSSRLKDWGHLAKWAKALENPALEHKMLTGFFGASQKANTLKGVSLEALKRLQDLAQLKGDEAQALQVAQARVLLAKKQQNKPAYTEALKDTAAVLLSQGQVTQAQKVLKLFASTTA